MYKLIVSDLDETLLNDEHKVCEKNIAAIKKATELGVKFVPATGKGTVSVSYSSNRYLELNKHGVNKGEAMLKLAELLGIKKEETIAVGDNFNDMSMLNAAGLSVAAGNAVAAVKKSCKYVCKNDNNEGVLAEVIEKFILN